MGTSHAYLTMPPASDKQRHDLQAQSGCWAARSVPDLPQSSLICVADGECGPDNGVRGRGASRRSIRHSCNVDRQTTPGSRSRLASAQRDDLHDCWIAIFPFGIVQMFFGASGAYLVICPCTAARHRLSGPRRAFSCRPGLALKSMAWLINAAGISSFYLGARVRKPGKICQGSFALRM
jgi:hypothetical protein